MAMPLRAKRLAAVFGPAIVVMLVAVATLRNIQLLSDRERLVRHAQSVELVTADLVACLTSARSALQSYLQTSDSSYVHLYATLNDSAYHDLEALQAATAGRLSDQHRLIQLTRITAARFANLDSIMAIRQTRGAAAALAVPTDRGRALVDTARTAARAITSDEETLLAARSAGVLHQRWVTNVVLALGAFFAILLGVLANSLLVRAAAREAEQNAQLREQAAELEAQAEQLQTQASEMETQTEQLQLQAADLEISNLAKSEFLTTMSHELRTPLNAIGGYAELLEIGVRGPLNAEQLHDIGRIRRASTHLLALINDILNVARLQAGQVSVREERVALRPILAEAESMIEPQARAKTITLEHLPCDNETFVMGDADRILQILINLLTNAVKFTASGGKVTVFCEDATGTTGRPVTESPILNEMIAVVIRDTGRGIPHDQLQRVFEPFVQVGRTLSGTDEGAGLGLAISQDLARAMDGDITAESVEGAGSTFRLLLQRAPELVKATALDSRPGRSRLATTETPL